MRGYKYFRAFSTQLIYQRLRYLGPKWCMCQWYWAEDHEAAGYIWEHWSINILKSRTSYTQFATLLLCHALVGYLEKHNRAETWRETLIIKTCCDPEKDRLRFLPHCSSWTVCLFLIRAVGEFSAQNENSRVNSHHHKTAKFSISRNYAWPDVSIQMASVDFSFFYLIIFF